MQPNQTITNLTLDPGISDTKIIWRVARQKPKLLLMPPEVVEVSEESIEFYKGRRIAAPSPENESWVEYGGSKYAVGFFAQSHGERVSPKDIKSEWAIAKVLAAVGVMAATESLPTAFDLALAVPLPYSEWRDKERFERDVKTALAAFSFCDKPLSVALKTFVCIPEGGGHVMARGASLGGSVFNSQKIASCMWGYRDISIICFDKGAIKGHTEPLGFLQFIEAVSDRISGYNSRERVRKLLEAVHLAGDKFKSNSFQALALSQNPGRRAEESESIANAVAICKAEYWTKTTRFFIKNIDKDCDEIIVGGGASDYYRAALKTFFAQHFPGCNISWAAGLEKDVILTFGIPAKAKALSSRLTDAYALSSYLLSMVTK